MTSESQAIAGDIEQLCTGESGNVDADVAQSVGTSVLSDRGISVWDLITENLIHEAVMAFKPYCFSPSLALSAVRRIAEHVPNTYLPYVEDELGRVARMVWRDETWGGGLGG
ncbi:hypothetical protein [Corynebacterium pseudokroppenstedtii]|uniref:hypothetical protein n=1 Tax=Corynebacterium pseudokroppenstedtii TaxID=2804917 RepID=UPI00254EBEAD|nr:hypothetical protein [Corynebacterium pseudokroppenstedtii]MDK7148516.1 hypothetical protein [Corynebacterium pseudokroppenstedtii]